MNEPFPALVCSLKCFRKSVEHAPLRSLSPHPESQWNDPFPWKRTTTRLSRKLANLVCKLAVILVFMIAVILVHVHILSRQNNFYLLLNKT